MLPMDSRPKLKQFWNKTYLQYHISLFSYRERFELARQCEFLQNRTGHLPCCGSVKWNQHEGST